MVHFGPNGLQRALPRNQSKGLARFPSIGSNAGYHQAGLLRCWLAAPGRQLETILWFSYVCFGFGFAYLKSNLVF